VTGKIQQVGVPMKIYAEQGAVQFVDAIVTSQASAGGDGGALVVSEDGCAVGMLVAGGKSASIVAPIQDVLERLQLELVFAGQNLTTLADPRIRPVDAVWLPDGQRIVVGAEDGAAYAWNVRTGQVEMTLDARTSPVSAVAVSPDGRWAAIGDADGAVRLWDLTTSSLLDLGTSTGMVNAVTFSPDGRWLAAGGEDAAVRVWDISAAPDPAKAPAALRDLQSAVTSIAISPDGYHLAAGGQDGVVLVWNLSTLESDASLTLRLENRIVDVFFNPDGGQLIATNVDAQAELRDMTTGREETFDWPVSPLSGVAWSPDGEQIVLVGSDGQALAVDLKDSTDLFTFSAHAGRITRAAWNPSGVQVLTIGADGALRVWQAK
jgi:WD40 repeat protein